MKDALSLGLTSIHDAGFRPVSLELFERYATLRFDSPRLNLPTERQATEGLLPVSMKSMFNSRVTSDTAPNLRNALFRRGWPLLG